MRQRIAFLGADNVSLFRSVRFDLFHHQPSVIYGISRAQAWLKSKEKKFWFLVLVNSNLHCPRIGLGTDGVDASSARPSPEKSINLIQQTGGRLTRRTVCLVNSNFRLRATDRFPRLFARSLVLSADFFNIFRLFGNFPPPPPPGIRR